MKISFKISLTERERYTLLTLIDIVSPIIAKDLESCKKDDGPFPYTVDEYEKMNNLLQGLRNI